MNLTGQTLRKVAATLTHERAASLAQISNELCAKYGIDSIDVYHEFLANILHESGRFDIRKESLNYTTPARLVAVWPRRFTLTGEPHKLDANMFVGQPAKLAEMAYGGRMGNIQKGDAYAFLGGGFAQITGRDAYTLFTKFVNARDVTSFSIFEVAKLVQTEDQWAFDSAFWFFCEFKNLEQAAMDDKMLEIVKRWNGGTVGIEERMYYYDRVKKHIV